MKRVLLIIFTLLWYAAAIGVLVTYVQSLVGMLQADQADKIFEYALSYYFIVMALCLAQMLLTWLTGRLYGMVTYRTGGTFFFWLVFCVIAPVCLIVNMFRSFKMLWILITQSPD